MSGGNDKRHPASAVTFGVAEHFTSLLRPRSAAVHAGTRGRGPVAAVLALTVGLLTAGPVVVGGTSVDAEAATVGPGTVALSPSVVSASSVGNVVQLRYTAPRGGLSAGVVRVTVPHGWTAPQRRSPARPGYVTASAGALRVANRSIKVSSLRLCGGCSLDVTYSGSRAPTRARVSRFTTRSAPTPGMALAPLAVQPTVDVVGLGPGTMHEVLGMFVPSQNESDVLSTGAALGVDPHASLMFAGGTPCRNGAGASTTWSGIPGQVPGFQVVYSVGSLSASEATAIGNVLVRSGNADAVIRPMWEMNQGVGGWFPCWNYQRFPTAASYISEWRTIVAAFRAVSGNQFTYLWNPTLRMNDQPGGRSWLDTYPGDGWVTFVGGDTYDASSDPPALKALDNFARQHAKQMMIPEWGLNGHDDPGFVDSISNFVHDPANNVALESYFNYCGSFCSTLSQFPRSAARYRADFGH